jgi:hypothetical protein
MLMSDSSPSGTIVTIRSDEMMLERLALVGFLAGYSGPTRESYRTDLRLFTAWLTERQVRLLAVQRTHIELYGRWSEEQGRARSTIGRRLSTLAGFYRYCEQEQDNTWRHLSTSVDALHMQFVHYVRAVLFRINRCRPVRCTARPRPRGARTGRYDQVRSRSR